MNKIFDCITFYNENLLTNARFEILNEHVDYFVVCESRFDHSGNKKELNFKLKNDKFKNKLKYIILEDKFPEPTNSWENERIQREKILQNLKDIKEDDIIMYSDSDEIPDPKIIKKIKLKKKYGIFLQKSFVYKLNIYNSHESPWEGTRICKKKNIKSLTFLRKKIKSKNLKKPFWKFYIESDIQIFDNGGWHFNNLYDPEIISKKLKVFPHKEYSSEKYSEISVIKNKIENLQDLFERNHTYTKVQIDKTYPDFILKNLELFKNYIL